MYAQSDWVNYQMDNTLFPSNPYKHITIDKNGHKWIATQNNGLFVYDGINWTLYDRTNSILTTNSINHVFFDSQDNAWISTHGGGLYKKQTDDTWRIYNSAISDSLGVLFPSNVINWVTEELSTYIWVGTSDGLVRIENHNESDFGQFRVYRSPIHLPSNDVRSIQIQVIDTVTAYKWIGTSQGLVRFSFDTGDPDDWDRFDADNTPLPANGIMSIHIDNVGDKWFSVHSWQSDTGVGAVRLSSSEPEITEEDWTVFDTQLPSTNVRAITHENMGVDTPPNIWFMTDTGIAKYDGTNWVIYNTTNTQMLPTNDFYSVAIENNYKWFGSSYNLVRFDDTNTLNLNFLNSGVPHNHIQTMTFNPLNPLVKWIGTPNGLTRFDGNNWRVFNKANSDLPINDIRTLAIDNEGFLWIGTSQFTNLGSGLIKQNITNNSMIVYTSSTTPALPWSSITKIAICSQNRIWIGTNGSGIISLRQTDTGDIWNRFNKAETALPSDNIFDIFIDESDFKWIATDAGVSVLNNHNVFIREYNFVNSDLPTNNIRKIKKDREGFIWAVTTEGLVKLIDDKWILFNNALDLSNPAVSDISFDAQNIKWISTSRGLFRTNEIDWDVYNEANSDLPSDNLTFVMMEDSVQNNGTGNQMVSSFKWLGSTDAGLTVFTEGHQKFENGAYITIFQHPAISNSLKITGVVNNFRVEEVSFNINNTVKIYEELAHNMWYTEHLVEQSQNVRITFKFWHANGDSTLVRDINVSMLQTSNSPIPLGNEAFLDVVNCLDISQWLVTDILNDDMGFIYYQFNDLRDFFKGNLILKASRGHQIQKRYQHTNQWFDCSKETDELFNFTFIEEGMDYRIIKNDEIVQNHVLDFINFPNPFNPTTNIYFALNIHVNDFRLEIFDIRGRKVRTLYKGSLSAGDHDFVWNGKNDLETTVASGVYFIRIFSDGKTYNRKTLLLK